jgi:serine/threonine protein kinase
MNQKNTKDEQRIQDFEEALFRGDSPNMEDFLGDGSEQRMKILPELVAAEIEFRLTQGDDARLEEYLARFPELAEMQDQQIELVQHEFQIREKIDPDICVEEFRSRFPLFSDISLRAHEFETIPVDSQQQTSRALNTQTQGRYELERVHAKGGLGAVWVASDESLDRKVAVKEVRGDRYATSSALNHRLVQEARITSRLEHPGVVPIYDHGVFDDGKPFYVMRLIKGKTFDEAFGECHKISKPGEKSLGMHKLLSRFSTVCSTIHYANSRNVIHRDIKPKNIILGDYGETLVVDWGLAKYLKSKKGVPNARTGNGSSDRDTHREDGSETKQGDLVGTPGYMSPEQARGDLDLLGPRSEVYSLGATLFSLVANSKPDKENFSKQIAALDRPLASICRKAMQDDPQMRYEDAALLADDLERYLAGNRPLAHQEGLFERSKRLIAKHSQLAILGLVSLGLIALITTALLARLASANRTIRARTESLTEEKQVLENSVEAISDLFSLPVAPRSGEQFMAEVIKNGESISQKLNEDPRAKSLILGVTSHFANLLGNRNKAIDLSRSAIEELSFLLPEQGRENFVARIYLSELLCQRERYNEAHQLATESIGIAEAEAKAGSGLDCSFAAYLMVAKIEAKWKNEGLASEFLGKAEAAAEKFPQNEVVSNQLELARLNFEISTIPVYDFVAAAKARSALKAAELKLLKSVEGDSMASWSYLLSTLKQKARKNLIRGKLDDAKLKHGEIVELVQDRFGKNHPESFEADLVLAKIQRLKENFEDAMGTANKAVDRLPESSGSDSENESLRIRFLLELLRIDFARTVSELRPGEETDELKKLSVEHMSKFEALASECSQSVLGPNTSLESEINFRRANVADTLARFLSDRNVKANWQEQYYLNLHRQQQNVSKRFIDSKRSHRDYYKLTNRLDMAYRSLDKPRQRKLLAAHKEAWESVVEVDRMFLPENHPTVEYHRSKIADLKEN